MSLFPKKKWSVPLNGIDYMMSRAWLCVCVFSFRCSRRIWTFTLGCNSISWDQDQVSFSSWSQSEYSAVL